METKQLDISISQTQADFMQDWKHEYQIASGAIRSGKTYGQIWKIKMFLERDECLHRVKVLIVGKTGDSVERNIIGDFMELAEGLGIHRDFTYTKQPRVLIYHPKKIEMWVMGANDEKAEERLRGMTAQALFGDEVTTWPESFFFQCIGRLSAGKGYKVITTNPDDPSHWFKRLIMDNMALSFRLYFFLLKDNPALTDRYVESLYAVYTGIRKKRFLEGQWVADEETLILPDFISAEKDIIRRVTRPRFCHKMVSIDVGFKDYTACLFGYYDYLEASIVIEDSIFLRKMNTAELAYALKEKEKELWGREEPYFRVSDTDLILIQDLNTIHDMSVRPTKKDNKEAQVNYTNLLIRNKKIIIDPRNEKLIYQCKTGTWRLININSDKPRKEFARAEGEGHYDGIDALIYMCRNAPKYSNPFPAGEGIIEDTHFVRDEIRNKGDAEGLVMAFGDDQKALDQDKDVREGYYADSEDW